MLLALILTLLGATRMRDALPFWTLALMGFALSTLVVWFVEPRWEPAIDD